MNNIIKSNSNKTINRVEGDRNKSILAFSNLGVVKIFELFYNSNITKKKSKKSIDSD